MSCVVPGCRSHMVKKKNQFEYISFHRIPKDKISKWQNIIPGEPELINGRRICSKHFGNNCFRSVNKRRKLKAGAIPTLFPDTEHQITAPQTAACASDHDYLSSSSKADSPVSMNQSPVSQNTYNDDYDDTSSSSKPSFSSFTSEESMQSVATSRMSEILSCNNCLDLQMKVVEIEKRVQKFQKLSRRRLLKINSLKQQVRRLDRKNTALLDRLIEVLKDQEVEEDPVD